MARTRSCMGIQYVGNELGVPTIKAGNLRQVQAVECRTTRGGRKRRRRGTLTT